MKTIAAAVWAAAMLDPAAAAEPDLQISRAGSRPVSRALAANFTGKVQVEMLFVPTGPDRTSAGAVTFPPGARTAWHGHLLGQTLIASTGV